MVPDVYQICSRLVPDCSHAVGACHPRGLPPVGSTICGAYCHIRNRTSNHPSHPTQQLRAPDSNSWQGLWKLVSTCVEACGTSSTRACLASSTRVERFQEVLNGFPKASRRLPERLYTLLVPCSYDTFDVPRPIAIVGRLRPTRTHTLLCGPAAGRLASARDVRCQ